MANLNPAITFQVNIPADMIGSLSPDRYQTNQDIAQSSIAFRTALINTWFPGLMNGENVELKSGFTFTAYGEKAHYILKTYCLPRNIQAPTYGNVETNNGPTLSVVAWEYSDGSSNPVGTSIPVFNGQYQVGSVTVEQQAPIVPA
jgi:hypothetical protein